MANHEMFCHREHPLGAGESSQEGRKSNSRTREKAEDVIVNVEMVEARQMDEEKVYQTMLNMSSEFFDGFLGRGWAVEVLRERKEGNED